MEISDMKNDLVCSQCAAAHPFNAALAIEPIRSLEKYEINVEHSSPTADKTPPCALKNRGGRLQAPHIIASWSNRRMHLTAIPLALHSRN
jgi:hypothetical protein